jgi:inositol phosphorylceramide mannosyltransferase catalytic subunit
MRRTQLPAVRLSVIFWLLVGVWGLFYFISHVLAFIAIFFTHAGLPLPQRVAADAFASNATDSLGRPREQLIPKILHQVFHNWHEPGNDELPDDWKAVRQTCIDHNPDWQHMVRSQLTGGRHERSVMRHGLKHPTNARYSALDGKDVS